MLCTTVFGTCQLAAVGVVPVGRMPAKTVGFVAEKISGGCERIEALI